MLNIESSDRWGEASGERITWLWGDEHVDGVLLPLVNECSDWPPTKVIQTAPDERKPDRGEINDRRREIELAQKPRFDRMQICGLHIEQVVRHQGAHMAVDHFIRNEVPAR